MGVEARLFKQPGYYDCVCSAPGESHSTIALRAEVSFKEVESSDAQLSPQCENESLFFGGSDKQTGIMMSNIHENEYAE